MDEMFRNEIKSDKAVKRVVAIVVGIILLAVAYIGGYYTYYFTMDEEVKTFQWVLNSIKKYYYEEITDEELLNTALSSISQNLLDAYSTYYSDEDYAIIQAQREGGRVGTGLSFMSDSTGGTTTVLKVSGNSPAERAKIKSGDVITKLGASLEDMTAVTNFNGIVEGFSKFSENQTFYIEYTREGVAHKEQISKKAYTESYVYYKSKEVNFGFFTNDSGTMEFIENPYDTQIISGLDAKTAYIKYTSFNGKSAEQFAKALEKFKADGKTKLILDLRTNGGGYMDILQTVGEYLVYKENTPLVAAVAKYKDGTSIAYNIKSSYYKNYNFEKIAVLANAYTASASECLIGAMLDYGTLSKENLIVSKFEGNEGFTYGKGIMQTTFTNPFSGAAIKLTTAKVHWPLSDICIHGVGIDGTAEETSSKKLVFSGEDNELKKAIGIMTPLVV